MTAFHHRSIIKGLSLGLLFLSFSATAFTPPKLPWEPGYDPLDPVNENSSITFWEKVDVAPKDSFLSWSIYPITTNTTSGRGAMDRPRAFEMISEDYPETLLTHHGGLHSYRLPFKKLDANSSMGSITQPSDLKPAHSFITGEGAEGFVFLPKTDIRTKVETSWEYDPTTPPESEDGVTKYYGKHTIHHVFSAVGDGPKFATRIDLDGIHFMERNFITRTGLNADGDKVVNVADGLIAHGSKDAINGGQLYDELQKLKLGQGGDVDWTRINRMGALSAALAGLHPMEYDERHRFSVSAAYGNYRNGHGFAAGLYFRPDHRTMVSAGLAMAPGGDKMLNLGASYRLGAQKNEYASTFKDFASSEVAHQITIKLRHVDETVRDQGQDIKAIKSELQSAKKEIADLKAQVKALMKLIKAPNP